MDNSGENSDASVVGRLRMIQARDAHAAGDPRAAEIMCEAAALLAGADSAAASEDVDRTVLRAAACRFAGQYLAENEEYARAASMYQQAVDQYLRLDSEEADANSRQCAGAVLDCIEALRARPEDRLNLLIAQYEDREREFALQAGHERQSADCRLHIAHILHRRGRFERSLESYEQAIDLYTLCGENAGARLGEAECHFRIGAIMAAWLNRKDEARRRIEIAERLYANHEPFEYHRQRGRDMCLRTLRELGD